MPARKQIRPGEKLPLKLTAAERKLVLEGLTCMSLPARRLRRHLGLPGFPGSNL